MTRPLLNIRSVGPDNDQYQLIEAVSKETWPDLAKMGSVSGLKLHWSWGDSSRWTLLYSVPREADLDKLARGSGLLEMAFDIYRIFSRVISLEHDFRLSVDLDSDERVRANEGWSARMRGTAGPDRHQTFAFKDGAACLAAD